MRRIEEALSRFEAISVAFDKANVETREKFSLSEGIRSQVITEMTRAGASDVMVLATCNRLECYWTNLAHDPASSILRRFIGVGDAIWGSSCRSLSGKEAVRHLFRVACSLESQIIGDTEITGQLKAAFKLTQQLGTPVPFLDRVVSSALKASKRVKTETGLSSGATSVAFSAIHYLRSELSNLEGVNVVLFGLGKLGRNTCKNLAKHARGATITVINRDELKSNEAAAEHGFISRSIENLEQAVKHARVLIVATGAQKYTVPIDMVGAQQELLILDMSMPRNVDPAIGALSGVTLLNVDQISAYAKQQMDARQDHIPKANAIVDEEFTNLDTWVQTQHVAPLLGMLSQNLKSYRDIELSRMQNCDGVEADSAVHLTDRLIQKVTNQVATYLRTQSGSVEDDMEMLQRVFNGQNGTV
ncbi:MAG: glutamyl-tRNA reductase [Flavobacteriales bacterium]|nr:glutamyl-tRNA reductase [Flavobacteriales bacterium]